MTYHFFGKTQIRQRTKRQIQKPADNKKTTQKNETTRTNGNHTGQDLITKFTYFHNETLLTP